MAANVPSTQSELRTAHRIAEGTQAAPSGPTPSLLPGTLELLILSALNSGPRHGYGIARAIEQASGDELLIEEGSLYPALHKLAKRGDCTADWQLTQTGRRARFYRLTASGKKRLAEQRDLWQRFSGAVNRALGADRAGGDDAGDRAFPAAGYSAGGWSPA